MSNEKSENSEIDRPRPSWISFLETEFKQVISGGKLKRAWTFDVDDQPELEQIAESEQGQAQRAMK